MRICNEITFFWNKFVLVYKFEVKQGEGNRLYKALTFYAKKASQETNRGVLKGKKRCGHLQKILFRLRSSLIVS